MEMNWSFVHLFYFFPLRFYLQCSQGVLDFERQFALLNLYMNIRSYNFLLFTYTLDLWVSYLKKKINPE